MITFSYIKKTAYPIYLRKRTLYLKCTLIDNFLIITTFETKECFETVVYLSEVVMEKMIGNRRKSIVDVGLFEL